MRIIVILMTLNLLSLCHAQTINEIDSSMTMLVSLNGNDINEEFIDLYRVSFIENNLVQRLDSLTYDYLFIQSTKGFENNTSEILEFYFQFSDSLPRYSFLNGRSMDSTQVSSFAKSGKTLKYFMEEYGNIKPIQLMAYDKMQTNRDNLTDKVFKEQRKQELKRTYRIQVFINRRTKTTLLSLQKPPENPTFKINH